MDLAKFQAYHAVHAHHRSLSELVETLWLETRLFLFSAVALIFPKGSQLQQALKGLRGP